MLAAGLVLAAGVAEVLHAARSPRVASLYVTVTGSDGRLIPNLGKEDFAVYEDGQPVRVVAISNEPPPLSLVLLLDRSNSMEEVSGGALSAAGESLTVASERQDEDCDLLGPHQHRSARLHQ